MKKILLALISVLLLCSCVACTAQDRASFSNLYEAYCARGEGVTGYEVTEIEEYENMEFFAVRVCLNTDDAQTVDDFVWFEANVMYFFKEEEAAAAYDNNQQTGLGGTCLREGRILIYWMENDPFSDLYKEVFYNVFGE